MGVCREAVLITLCVSALTACDSGRTKSAPTGSGATETTASVSSSLQDLTTLSPGIRWTATTSLPPAQVREVRFYVAGHRWWVDRTPPYTYGPEGSALPLRFISSVSGPGDLVTFGVRVLSTEDKRWSAVSHARTPQPSLGRNAPGSFGEHGRYPRFGYYGFGRLSPADLANPPQGDLLSSYTGGLDFIGAAVFASGDEGSFAWELASDDKRISLGTAIYLDARGGPASSRGHRMLRKTLCGTDAPPATYSWSVRRGRLYYAPNYYVRYLELRPLNESCDARRKMLEGVWEEVTD